MSPEIQKYFDTYFELFSSDGWKTLVKDLEDVTKQAVDSTHLLEKSEQFFERKGTIHAYKYILNLPTIVEANYEDLVEQEKEVQDEENV
jgi:hypothetical protein